jgi:SAM-dependent MidA family methyltransferase
MIETFPNTLTLAARLRERIRNEGPIPFYDWMKAALYDPEDGYYCRVERNKWGREGDYRTSPERSSMFAATLARYFTSLYEENGRPKQWTIVEVGAGDGHFASGVLQTLQASFPAVFKATSYVIDEVSSHSRALARQRLAQFANRVEFKSLDDVKLDAGVVFSNELLDAFPVHRVMWQETRLQEFYVQVGGNGNFEWLLGAPSARSSPRLIKYFEDSGLQLGEGQVAEVSLEIEEWLDKVADKIHDGYLVTVDYGAAAEDLYSSIERRRGTLRGFYRHEFTDDLLARPGEQDLTTTVNWSFVKSVGARLGFEVVEFQRQDRFLLAAGLLEQLEIESRHCKSEADRLRLSTAAREMILPDGMASHFQVLVQKKTDHGNRHRSPTSGRAPGNTHRVAPGSKSPP